MTAHQKVVDNPKPIENVAMEQRPIYITGSRPYRSAKRPQKYELPTRPIMKADAM